MGPPGAGKGTQATRLADALSVPAISTGDIFRSNVAAGTPLGVQAQRYMNAGGYVPDSVTDAMLEARLDEPEAANGWLLDGYPRTVGQVAALEAVLEARSHRLNAVLVLTVDEEELVQRLAKRALTEGRADDTEEVIRRRQEAYQAQTAPLPESFEKRGLLTTVPGSGPVAKVAESLFEALPLRQGCAAGARRDTGRGSCGCRRTPHAPAPRT
jgi:adenylate kinase